MQKTPESSFIPALQCESTFFNSLGETSTACLLAAEELERIRFNESKDSLDMGSRLHPSFSVSILYHLGRSA